MQTRTTMITLRGPWGIPIHVSHSVLFLLLVYVGVWSNSIASPMDGLILFAILMASILTHELGHAWAARVLRVPVQRLVLHGGGGNCLHASAGTSASELIVIMGPITNLGLWAVLSLGAQAIWASVPDTDLMQPGALATHRTKLELAYWLWLASNLNLVLFLFNLIPVQPLDGGKLLHIWLLRVLRHDHALQVVGCAGLVCTILWIPAMIILFLTDGFLLLLLPSVHAHLAILRGGVRLNRLYRQ